MSLRPIQGQCLLALDEANGTFSNAAVGLGKSLILSVAMALRGGARPLVFTEASNIPQMSADITRYRAHFRIPTAYRLESYDTLSNHPEMLDEIRPTFVGLDEAQRVKAPRPLKGGKPSGRSLRVARWRRDNPEVPVMALSGTPGEQFCDYAHLLVWAVPALAGTLIPVNDEGLPAGGEFRKLCQRLAEDSDFHRDFWTKLRATPGIVITSETFTDIPLHIQHSIHATPPEMEEHWHQFRVYGEAPDGWLLEGPDKWDFARTLANGVFLEHIPRPPEPFRKARRAWAGFIREIIDMGELARGGPYDTDGQVVEGVLSGALPNDVYNEWMAQKPTYQHIVRPRWLSEAALEEAAAWGREVAATATRKIDGGIIWVRRTEVGERLSALTGWPYYGEGAMNATRGHVKDATAAVIICSVNSCGTGKNLQRYSRNYYMNPQSNHKMSEQSLGRTHRSMQMAERVDAVFKYGCMEDWAAAHKAEAAAVTNQDDLTAPAKLTLAHHQRVAYPLAGGYSKNDRSDDADDNSAPDGWAWKKANGAVVVEIPDE